MIRKPVDPVAISGRSIELLLAFHLLVVCQSRDDLPQVEQTLIDLNRFLELLWVSILPSIYVALSLASRQIDKLELRRYNVIWLVHINLGDSETKYAVAPAARVIDLMASHHLILESFAEILETILDSVAIKLKHVLDSHVVVSPELNLETWHSIKVSLAVLKFVKI